MANRSALERTLLLILLGLASVMAAMTVAGFIAGKRPGDGLRPASVERESPSEGESEYDGFGTQRLKLKNGGVLVFRPVLSYRSDGAAPREEIIAKKGELLAAMVRVLDSKDREGLSPAQEGRVKAEFLDSFRTILSVTSITGIYFLDYEILD